MLGRQMWFGNETHAQWVPLPAVGMTRGREGYAEEIALDGGGLHLSRTAQSAAVYEANFPVRDSSEYEGIEAFDRFQDGEYGDEPVRFIDMMQADQNLFSAGWASPGLAEQGWEPIYDTVPTFSDTGANSYTKPPRKAVYSVTSAADALPTRANSTFTLLVPPTQTIHIGGSGAVTGTAVLRIQPVNLDGSLATVVDVTLTSDATAPAFSATFSGATYKSIRVYVTRTSTATSTITLTALWAQCAKTGTTPSILRHIPGKGHTGLGFRGASRVESYENANGHKVVGASIVLGEVEAWAS